MEKMTLQKFQDFIDWEIERLNSFLDKSNEELKPWSAIKLSEEVGELQSEVIGYAKLHRKEKMDRFSKESFGKEVADVIITACIVGRRHDIDIVDALNNKIKIIQGRVY